MMNTIIRSFILTQRTKYFKHLSLLQSFRNVNCAYNMTKTALVILAPGAEEMEFVIATDVLRRAGIKVTVAGLIDANVVKCSRGVLIKPDVSLETAAPNSYDVIVMPGGLEGSNAMAESVVVGALLKKQEKENRYIAAICAAPIALVSHDIFPGKHLTSYPSMKDRLADKYKYENNQDTVIDGKLITSRGPGTAFDFALKVVNELVGKEKVAEISSGMLLSTHVLKQ